MIGLRQLVLLAAAASLSLAAWSFAGCSSPQDQTRPDESAQRAEGQDESAETQPDDEQTRDESKPKVCADEDARACYFEGMRLEAADKSREALSYFNEACQMGHMSACFDLGVMQEQGRAGVANPERAYDLYKKACEADEPDAKACNNLAGMYHQGRVIDADPKRAVELYERSCELGEMLGCRNLARHLRDGDGVDQDTERAEKLYERACMRGQPEACPRMTYIEALDCGGEDGCQGDPGDPEDAVEPLRRACEEDESARGCLGYGFLVQSGVAGEQADATDAVEHYQSACDQESWAGCNFLANMYRDGDGVERDAGRAIELYEEACDGGFALSCHTLGVMYVQGIGTDKDEQRGYDYLKQACDGGRNPSCTTLEFQCFLDVEEACD